MTHSAYVLRRRARMRSIRFMVKSDGTLVVSAAKYVPLFMIERLIVQKKEWIDAQRERLLSRPRLVPPSTAAAYQLHKRRALEVLTERVEHFSRIYGLAPTKIKIGRATTRWGSCSKSGVLTFTYRAIFLEPNLLDYLVVHELCHLKEFNHSLRFWKLVGVSIADYKVLRKVLRAG